MYSLSQAIPAAEAATDVKAATVIAAEAATMFKAVTVNAASAATMLRQRLRQVGVENCKVLYGWDLA